MTTTTRPEPLEKFRATRDQLMNTVLGSLGDLESEVIQFEHARSTDLTVARRALDEAHHENERLRGELNDLAASLADHAAPAAESGARLAELQKQLAAATADASRVAELTAQLETTRAENTGLSKQLAAAVKARDEAAASLASLRAAVETATVETEDLLNRVADAEQQLAELRSRPAVTGISEQEVEARITQVRAGADGNAKAETLRVLHAIHADNPDLALTEALDLFTVAYDVAAAPAAPIPAAPVMEAVPAPAPAPVAAVEPAVPVLNAVAPLVLPDLDEDPFADDPAPAPGAVTPAVADPQIEGTEDPITDPHFFDIPPTLDAPPSVAPVLGGPVDAPLPVPPLFTGPTDAPAAVPADTAPVVAPVKAFPVPAVQSLDLDFDLFAEPAPEKKVA